MFCTATVKPNVSNCQNRNCDLTFKKQIVSLFSNRRPERMITPRFSLTQDDRYVTFLIRAPYCSLGELDVSVEDDTFIFTCKPYYLRLVLPGRIVENDRQSSSFNSDDGEFTFSYEKAVPGEHFPDLHFITKLLVPKLEVNERERSKITILTSEGQVEEETLSGYDEFGFAMKGNTYFKSISAEFPDVFEIDPREVNLSERKTLRMQYEHGKFSSDHYIADFIEDEEIIDIIKQKSPWTDLKTTPEQTFTIEEQDFLKDLQNKEYNLTETQKNYCYNGLIDILFGYCYDRRTTYYKGSSESNWNVSKISATFCWFDGFKTPKEALICGFRRALIYPLYRSFELNNQILQDLRDILKLGETYLIKCLINLYVIFGNNKYYILNDLFIKDYVRYAMKWDKSEWAKVVEEVSNVVIKKEDLGLNLKEIEDNTDICRKLSSLNIRDLDSDDDSTSDSSSDSESSSDYYDSSSDSSD